METLFTTPGTAVVAIGGNSLIKDKQHQTVVDQYIARSEEHTSELQSLRHLVCRLLLGKKKRCQSHFSRSDEPAVRRLRAGSVAVLQHTGRCLGARRAACLTERDTFFFLRNGQPPKLPLSPNGALPA